MTCPLVSVAEMNVLVMLVRTCDARGVGRDFCPRRRFAARMYAAAMTVLLPLNQGEIGIGIRVRMFGWYPTFLSLPPGEKVDEGGRVRVFFRGLGYFQQSPSPRFKISGSFRKRTNNTTYNTIREYLLIPL